MKKYYLLFSLVILSSMSLFAKGGIKVVCGDLSVINKSDITATVLFDYTNLKIEGKPYMEHLESKGKDFVRDWPSETLTSETYFIKCWNHDNDDGLQVTASSGNEYKMVFVVTEMDMGSGAASMLVGFGAGGATMNAMMYIIQGDNNVPILSVKIDGQSGRSGMTELVRRTDLYGELAEDLVETIQKTKPSKVPASTKTVSIPSLSLKQKASTNMGVVESQTQKVNSVSPQVEHEDSVKEVATSIQTEVGSDDIIQFLVSLKGEEIQRRRKPVLGDFDGVKNVRDIGVFLDFSDAEIMGRREKDFVRYMKTSASKKDLDRNFPETWENDIKPELISSFCVKINEELKDEKIKMRFNTDIDYDYILKIEVVDIDDDGNNKINFLIVNMKSRKVEAQITCESDGGRVGRFVGLLQQGFESAAESFAEEFIDQID